MSRLTKIVVGVAVAIAIISVVWLPLALGLMAGFPFALWEDDEVEPVGARTTFEESVDCLFEYRHYSAERDLGVRLNREEVGVCFPPQTAAKEKALIACFNRYERNHPNHIGWPEENMGACTWDGLEATPTPYGLTFGDVTTVPAEPQAGERVVVNAGVRGGDAAGEEVNAAIESGALEAVVTVGRGIDGMPLDLELGSQADGKIRVSFTVPETATGKRVTIKLTIGPDTHTGTKIVGFTVAR